MAEQPLYLRKTGRVVLTVWPTEGTTLLKGHAHSDGRLDTRYSVRANGRILGSMTTLAEARAYCDAYQIRYGLLK